MKNEKKGLAFVTTSPTDATVDAVLLGGKSEADWKGASWYYSWSPVSPVADAHGAEFVPMLWDASPAQWAALRANYHADYTGWLMFLNEPNHPQQANMSPETAAITYHALRLEYPLAQIVAPGCWDRPLQDTKTNEWSAGGDHWLTEWREAHWRWFHSYPDVAAYAVHYYTSHDPFTAVERFWNEWVTRVDGRPDVGVWLTEFRMCNEWWERVENYDLATHFRKQVRAMETLPYLQRWAYFANREYLADPIVSNDTCHIGLMTDERPTPLGLVYLDL